MVGTVSMTSTLAVMEAFYPNRAVTDERRSS